MTALRFWCSLPVGADTLRLVLPVAGGCTFPFQTQRIVQILGVCNITERM
jgi:hypothetical protein